MKWALIIAVVLVPAILYAIALVVVSIRDRWSPRRCPQCGKRTFRCVNFVKGTICIDCGRAPDHWSYYVCDECGHALKWHRSEWKPVPESELYFLNEGRR